MTLKREDIEIMAPVGSYESLMAAIQGGAGSVYFGVEHLNMRSRSANNFSLDDLIKFCFADRTNFSRDRVICTFFNTSSFHNKL